MIKNLWPVWSVGICLWQPSTLLCSLCTKYKIDCRNKICAFINRKSFEIIFQKKLSCSNDLSIVQPTRDSRALFTPNSFHHSEYLSLSSTKHSLKLWSVPAILYKQGRWKQESYQQGDMGEKIITRRRGTRGRSWKEHNCHSLFFHNNPASKDGRMVSRVFLKTLFFEFA